MDIGDQLLASVLPSAFGLGYFVYGKKQQMYVPMISGAALMVYPYFIETWLPMILIGLVLVVLPFVLRF